MISNSPICPIRSPAPGEVVVAIKAAGLNFFDTLIIAGKYQFKPQFPFSPGGRVFGRGRKPGQRRHGFVPGDRVMGYIGWGAARERLAVAADKLVKVPADLDFERAAGLGVTYGTTYHALHDRARLKPGETLTVLGASGGVGTGGRRTRKADGRAGHRLRVIGRETRFRPRARGRRAESTTQTETSATELRRLAEKGVDCVYDPVGGAYAEPALRSMGWQGRYLVVGFAAGEIPKLPLNLVLLKGCDVLGVFWGSWVSRDPASHRANMTQLAAWCADGKLSSHIHAVYPLPQTAQALNDIATRKVMGKALLRP